MLARRGSYAVRALRFQILAIPPHVKHAVTSRVCDCRGVYAVNSHAVRAFVSDPGDPSICEAWCNCA